MNSWSSSNCGGILCYSVMLCNRHFLHKYLKGSLSVSCDPLDFLSRLETLSYQNWSHKIRCCSSSNCVGICVILWCYATGTSCTSIWKAPWVYPVIRKIFYHALKPCRTKTNPTGSNLAPAPIVVLFCGILWCYATSTSCLWEPPRAVISAQEQERLIGLISVKISSNEIFELSNDHNI